MESLLDVIAITVLFAIGGMIMLVLAIVITFIVFPEYREDMKKEFKHLFNLRN